MNLKQKKLIIICKNIFTFSCPKKK